MLQKTKEWLWIELTHSWDIKLNSTYFEFSFGLIVIEFGFIECDQFEDDHCDRKDVGFVDIIFDLIVHPIDCAELFRSKDELLNPLFFSESFIITAMFVVVF